MNFIIRGLIGLMLCGTVSWAGAAEGPRAVIEQMEHHFGAVLEGQVLPFEFLIRNEGSAPLNILETKADCGCTVARYDRVIPPGEAGAFHVTVDTKGFRGEFTSRVLVVTDDPIRPRMVFTLLADIQTPFEVVGGDRIMLSGCAGNPFSTKKTVVSAAETPVRITGTSTTLPDGVLKTEVKELEAGKTFELTLTATPVEPSGRYSGRVILHTDHPVTKEILLGVRVYALPPANVDPEEVIFDFRREGGGNPAFVTVSFCGDPSEADKEGPAYRPVQLIYDTDLFQVSRIENPNSNSWYLTIIPREAHLPKTTREYTLLIETDMPKNKYLPVRLKVVH